MTELGRRIRNTLGWCFALFLMAFLLDVALRPGVPFSRCALEALIGTGWIMLIWGLKELLG